MTVRIPKYVVLEKKRGETPLEVLNVWKGARPQFADVPMSYAGRLDPMAEGKLLVLLGEECKKQDKYTKLDKEYVVEVLLGAGSDTGDILGLVALPDAMSNEFLNAYETHSTLRKSATNKPSQYISTASVKRVLKNETGSHSRKYPVYSSKTVQGKPLFLYALEGTLDSITIPEHIETIYSISFLGSYQLRATELQEKITGFLSLVPRSDEPSKALGADFRQDAVRDSWNIFFNASPQREFTILRIKVICSSGSYMRTLAQRIGTELGTSGLAFSIKRAKLGKYALVTKGLGFWSKKY